MRGGSVNSFFRFVLGFTVFIAVSLGLTIAVTTVEEDRQEEEQTAAAFETFLGSNNGISWAEWAMQALGK